MKNNKWYISTWLIALLFAFWFLVIPLITGIFLLYIQKRERVNYQRYVEQLMISNKELMSREEEIESRGKEIERQFIEKQKELIELESIHQERLAEASKKHEVLLKEKEHAIKEEIEKQKNVLFNKEEKLKELQEEHQQKLLQLTRNKEEELSKLEVKHQQKLLFMTKEREEELISREQNIKVKEKDIQFTFLEKQKEISKLEMEHKQNLIWMTKIREEELVSREMSVSKKENEIEEIIAKGQDEVNKLQIEIKRSTEKSNILKSMIITLEDEVLYQSFGFYDTRFDLENSEEYKHYLELVRNAQKKLVKENRATLIKIYPDHTGMLKKDSLKNNNIKLAIRSFNNECDSVISKVKFNNVEMSEKRIRASFQHINELNHHNSIELTDEFLHLKLEELFLAYEYAQKKQEEKEEQRRINEQMREERKAQQELEEQLKILNKEEKHIENVMQHSSQFSEQRVNELKTRLEEIRRQKEEVDYRVKNTKAGYIYVISNIGSFGETIYKIGMTRRLDPMDRVRELGGASVPFRFDVHAVIFSDNAPELEASLHRTFSHRRVNKINERKEFFNVRLEEIKKVVNQNHDAVIEFTMVADAKEYRETKKLEEKIAEQYII
ncbi:DUF4041 domain-containing protein [Ferdinandcohnia sp. SAFN-114]|uniref:DUF4041 domain-containing protein n=1 Tax=Ferdinandcohnia sp. SAFN-114 TaxID=3387275 RepID=UPI003F7D7026